MSLRRSLVPAQVHVQVKNLYARGRILRTRARLVAGTQMMLDLASSRSEDSKRPNTGYVERLNLFLRRSCAYQHRRIPSPMRKPQRLADALEILRCYYNVVRRHSSLRFGKTLRTPAMQAGLIDRPLTFREIFSQILPPPPEPITLDFRHALQRPSGTSLGNAPTTVNARCIEHLLREP